METTNQTQSTAMQLSAQYDHSLNLFKGGGQILMTNEMLASKIVASGQSILKKIQENNGKLNPELDKLCNDFIAKVNTRKTEMEETRKPITQMMTAVQKLFTGIENSIDVKKPDTVVGIIQDMRNSYAREIAEQQKKKAAEAEREAAKKQAKVAVLAKCEMMLNDFFNTHLLSEKQKYQHAFNTMTLSDINERGANLEKIKPAYAPEHFRNYLPNIQHALLNTDELYAIILEAKKGKFEVFAQRFQKDLQELLSALVAKIPSKRKELEELAQANEDQKKALQDAQAKREEAEEKAMQEAADKATADAETAIAMKQSEEETMILFEKEVSAAVDEPMPETREGFDIEVTHQAGFVQIFQFWFENEGRNLSIDKIEKKTMKQMKSFCEKEAMKTGEMIESKFIKYNPIFKAVNRKS